ncbi:MAG: D-alanine--D-alanine ligase, partial [Mangrovicoccus sp.]
MSPKTDPLVAVLLGGPSAEREVSLSTGRECANALRTAGYRVTEIDPGLKPGPGLAEQLCAAAPDVVFNALHGRMGEDGAVQGLLNWLGIPYTHSNLAASALAMDKQKSKAVLRQAGLPVVDSRIVAREEVQAAHVMDPPYVVKPNDEGSSVGVYLVHEAANGPPQLGPEMPAQVMVERFAPGRELTTAVLGDRALTVTDILTDGWYDYDAKY